MRVYGKFTYQRGLQLALVVLIVAISLILVVKYSQTNSHTDSISFRRIISGMSGRMETRPQGQMQPTIDPWSQVPELELFVRMFYGRKGLYEQVFVQSLKVFCPRNLHKLVAVLDDESPADHKWATTLRNNFPYPRVMFEKPSIYYNGRGHDRQQLTMFYADLYTKAEYVGFVDTDTVFVTPVTPSMLFEDGKPVIIGVIGVDPREFWRSVSPHTSLWFKHKEVMTCMSYFPFIVKVQHIVELRKRAEEIHNKTFGEVFKQLTGPARGTISQFSVMCQFVWMYHRDEYKFYFQSVPNDNWSRVIPGRVPKDYYKHNTRSEQHIPRPRAAAHWRYPEPFPPKRNMLNLQWFVDMLTKGFCYSIGLKYCPEKCHKINNNTLQRRLYLFEGNDWSWHPACLQQQQKHYRDVEKLIQYYNDSRKPVLGADSIEDVCKKWPSGYKFVYR